MDDTKLIDYREPMLSPMLWEKDGVDHINLWERGQTELGRALSNNNHVGFTHEMLGRFSNIESFWNYIRSHEHDDRIRVMTGRTLLTFSRKLTRIKINNFRAIILEACWMRVQQHQRLAEDFMRSTLPLDCYYVKANGIRIRPVSSAWIVRGMEEIRAGLRTRHKPNFDSYRDTREGGLYDDLLAHMNLPIPK